MTEIIKLKDDAVTSIDTNHWSIGGCPTCDWGSDYCTEIEIYFKNHPRIIFERHKMYYYDEDFSVGYFIKLFCTNYEKFADMTASEFVDFITTEITRNFEVKIRQKGEQE